MNDPHLVLAAIALALAAAGLVFPGSRFPLVAVAVILLAIEALIS